MDVDALTIVNTGVTIAAGGASSNVALPVVSGAVPKYCRIAATAAAYVKVGVGAGTAAVAGDMLVQPADAVIVRTHGLTHVAALQVSGGGIVQISPVENQ